MSVLSYFLPLAGIWHEDLGTSWADDLPAPFTCHQMSFCDSHGNKPDIVERWEGGRKASCFDMFFDHQVILVLPMIMLMCLC